MIRPNTPRIVAMMADVHLRWEIAVSKAVGDSMSAFSFPVAEETTVITGGRGSSPLPASISVCALYLTPEAIGYSLRGIRLVVIPNRPSRFFDGVEISEVPTSNTCAISLSVRLPINTGGQRDRLPGALVHGSGKRLDGAVEDQGVDEPPERLDQFCRDHTATSCLRVDLSHHASTSSAGSNRAWRSGRQSSKFRASNLLIPERSA